LNRITAQLRNLFLLANFRKQSAIKIFFKRHYFTHLVLLETTDEQLQEKNTSKKEKIKTMLVAAANTSGQQFYFNYANLVAVGIGATPIEMSFITSIQNLGSALLQGFFGRLSDKIGRKIVLLLGFIIATITTAFLAYNSSTISFMIIIAAYSIGISMIIPSWNALVGDISTEKSRVKILGQLGMIGTITASIILLVLGFFTDYLPFPETYWIFPEGLTDYKYRFMMFCGALLFALASIFVIFLQETNRFKAKNPFQSIKKTFQNRKFAIFTAVTLVWWFVMSFLWPLNPYILKRLNPSSAEVAVLSAVFSASMAIAQISAKKVVNKIGRKMTIFVGLISFCLVPFILIFSYYWYIIIFANIFGGASNGIVMVAINAEILDMADLKTKGAYTGAYNLMMGVVTFCGSFLCGIIFEFVTKGISYLENSFFYILQITLIILTITRLGASVPVLIYALKNRQA